MSGTEAYRKTWDQIRETSLYNSPWWLDTVCGEDGWEVIQIRGSIDGFFPYFKTKIGGLKAVTTPPMTQRIGVLSSVGGNKEFHLSHILSDLPKCSILRLAVEPDLQTESVNPGYAISTRYTYTIRYHGELEDIRAGYSEGLRRNLKEATQKYEVVESTDIQTLCHLVKSSFKGNYPHLHRLLPVIASNLLEKKQGSLKMALQDDTPIAAILTGRDSRTTYYLAGGRGHDPGSASAHALLLDRMVEESFRNRTAFDFEGSMHPGIANFFQSFGAKPEAYREISRHRGLGKIWQILH